MTAVAQLSEALMSNNTAQAESVILQLPYQDVLNVSFYDIVRMFVALTKSSVRLYPAQLEQMKAYCYRAIKHYDANGCLVCEIQGSRDDMAKTTIYWLAVALDNAAIQGLHQVFLTLSDIWLCLLNACHADATSDALFVTLAIMTDSQDSDQLVDTPLFLLIRAILRRVRDSVKSDLADTELKSIKVLMKLLSCCKTDVGHKMLLLGLACFYEKLSVRNGFGLLVEIFYLAIHHNLCDVIENLTIIWTTILAYAADSVDNQQLLSNCLVARRETLSPVIDRFAEIIERIIRSDFQLPFLNAISLIIKVWFATQTSVQASERVVEINANFMKKIESGLKASKTQWGCIAVMSSFSRKSQIRDAVFVEQMADKFGGLFVRQINMIRQHQDASTLDEIKKLKSRDHTDIAYETITRFKQLILRCSCSMGEVMMSEAPSLLLQILRCYELSTKIRLSGQYEMGRRLPVFSQHYSERHKGMFFYPPDEYFGTAFGDEPPKIKEEKPLSAQEAYWQQESSRYETYWKSVL